MKIKLYLKSCSILLVVSALLLCFGQQSYAQQQPIITLSPVISTGLDQPIQFVHAGDGTNRVFIVQKGGGIRVYDSAFNFLADFLTVTNITTAGERGLLSMAFHPDYENNGLFYVYYTNANGDLEIARYGVGTNPNVADATSKVVVITIPHPNASNHNGGELHFGDEGYLYLSTGDGGGAGDVANNAQNTSVLLGKMIRLEVNTSDTPPYYTIPAGNPYNNEVFDLGLRNPYRWSFDRLTNDMWIGDVGQDSYEEINFRPGGTAGGLNYGWRCYEGDSTFNTSGCAAASNYVFPAYAYPSQDPAASITGGVVYRGNASPALYGYYVAADFYSGVFYLINRDSTGAWVTNMQTLTQTGIVDFGETEAGELYVVSLTNGIVYRLNAASGGPLPVRLGNFSGSIVNKAAVLNWATSMEVNLQRFEVEYSLNGSTFRSAGVVTANDAANGAAYTFTHVLNNTGPVFYRLKMLDDDGNFRYSATIRLFINERNGGLVSPTVITNGNIIVNLSGEDFLSVDVVSANGVLMLTRKLEGLVGRINIPAGRLAPGMYIVRFNSRTQAPVTEQIMVR